MWSDLATTPGAELFGRRTPAPHARIARFSKAIVHDGDTVVVEAETTDDVAIDEAAYRTTSARRVTGARALVVGVGEDGATALERELAARGRVRPVRGLPRDPRAVAPYLRCRRRDRRPPRLLAAALVRPVTVALATTAEVVASLVWLVLAYHV